MADSQDIRSPFVPKSSWVGRFDKIPKEQCERQDAALQRIDPK
jgi:hypothetical protein